MVQATTKTDVISLFFILSSLALLIYIYGGYAALIGVLARGRKQQNFPEDGIWPMVTVLLTVHNEEAVVAARIQNLLDNDYPENRLKIVVASDGSTDATNDIVRGFEKSGVRLFMPKSRLGKSDTQNQAIARIEDDVIVFTDAESRFQRNTIRRLVAPFMQSEIGFSSGRLEFLSHEDNALAQSQNRYWEQEMKIRDAESKLGILAVGTGAVMAVRRECIQPMPSHIGEDCVLPLMALSAGYKAVHVDSAQATDYLHSAPKDALRARIRMTLRNWQGTWLYPALLNPLRNPGIAFSLWSHKLLRWLSPLFLLIWIGSSVVSLTIPKFWVTGLPGAAFLALALASTVGIPFPGAQTIKSFLVANLGFALGVIYSIIGRNMISYGK